jgi:penicillin amidase
MTTRPLRPAAPDLLLAALLLATFASPGAARGASPTLPVPGLTADVRVVTDAHGVRHVVAENDFDLARAQGFVHARDRFFQMDLTRREVSGDLAELLGDAFVAGDVQNRTIGLRRAAERSEAILTPRERNFLQAYADGVNAWLASNPLPPEYAQLELTSARPWTVVDTLSIGKGIAASLSLDIDAGLTERLQAYIAAGTANGFDGEKLFFEDVRRSAPIDPASTVPDATSGFPFVAQARRVDRTFVAKAGAGARRVREKLERSRFLAQALDRRDTFVGSNEWGVAGTHAIGRMPIIANDPHLALDAPSTFYENHIVVKNDPETGPLNASGVAFPGAPGVILGQNEQITWGATTNPMDVTDIFLDTLESFQPTCPASVSPSRLCIVSGGQRRPVVFALASYYSNRRGDGIPDNVEMVPLGLGESVILTVPFRSFGPVVDISDPGVISGGGTTTALVLQFTGFHATREVGAFLKWNRARDLGEFLDGLADFDFGSQNWAYADRTGNLAYFASAELPLRADLEAGSVHGLPPFFVRDGSGPANWVPDVARSQGQAIPFAVLPAAEMPHTVNPPNGFFVNANNDPAGTTLDNDPLNQHRPSNPTAIYYLSGSYGEGLRAGRITRLVRGKIDAGERISFEDMQAFQANTQQLDAELMLPFLLQAFDDAAQPGAPPELAALAADSRIAAAIDRLRSWDWSTPTGIPEGFDAHDVKGRRKGGLSKAERRASVAATLYNVWRAKAIRSVIDARLAALGVLSAGAGDALKALHHLLSEAPFDGVGHSGVDFFPSALPLADAEDRRDHALLVALRAALDALASDAFAPAFGNSTNLDDYRWGRLHRVTFDHRSDPLASIPPQAGYADLAPGLPGISRDGGYEVVNASGFSARADSVNGFRFGSGPVRRYVGQPLWGKNGAGPRISGENVVPGGSSGIPGDPLYAAQLGDWLTADYHVVDMSQDPSGPGEETLTPAP